MAKRYLGIRDILNQAQKDFVKYNLERRKLKLLAQLGEKVYEMYKLGKLNEVPDDIQEIFDRIERIERRLSELDE